jgi:hypothetical protein
MDAMRISVQTEQASKILQSLVRGDGYVTCVASKAGDHIKLNVEVDSNPHDMEIVLLYNGSWMATVEYKENP